MIRYSCINKFIYLQVSHNHEMAQQKISNEQMTHVRRSLAEAGIYFDKLCINQVGEMI